MLLTTLSNLHLTFYPTEDRGIKIRKKNNYQKNIHLADCSPALEVLQLDKSQISNAQIMIGMIILKNLAVEILSA
ncbi:hypothetical protein CDG77_21465 [Nostoc sp. 'Peltigera membranacea cyanobiont' 213]|nr:hypothetical protein CDG77_21465 [Nostoc sp. 'Peltigera membranacea cyanobiont' 213]